MQANAPSGQDNYQEVFATLDRQLGIGANTATIADSNGRPRNLGHREPIREPR